MWMRRVLFLPNPARMAALGSRLQETLRDRPLHDGSDSLLDSSGCFGFAVPHGGEAFHDVFAGDLVNLFASDVGEH